MSVTDDDRRMVLYFIEEKSDVSRWTGWERRRDDIEKVYPDLFFAFQVVKAADVLLQAALDKIRNDITE